MPDTKYSWQTNSRLTKFDQENYLIKRDLNSSLFEETPLEEVCNPPRELKS